MDISIDKQALRIERQFNVAPEVVFDTFTKPALMKIWWGPNVEFNIDLCLDGRWTIIRRDNGKEYLATGVYLQVDRPSRLQYTYAMPQFSPNIDTITVQIKAHGTGCLVVFEQAGDDIAEELRVLAQGDVSASESGWQQGFDLMQTAWSKTVDPN